MKNNTGIMVFKDVFDYYVEGEINKDQFVEVMMLIYDTKWGNGEREINIDDKDVRMIWRMLRHSIKKSVQNAKDYNTKKTKNNQDIPSNTDFYNEAPAPKEENENKADFSDFQTLNDIIPQPIQESVSKGQEIGKNEELQIPYDVMEKMRHFANDESIPINERYSKISRLFKPYSTSIPTNRIPDCVKHIYEEARKVA